MPSPAAAVPGRRQFLAGLAGTAVTASAGGLLAACGSASPAAVTPPRPRPRRGGNLRVGLTGGSSSDTLDPHQGLNYLDTARAVALYDTLVRLGADAGSSTRSPRK